MSDVDSYMDSPQFVAWLEEGERDLDFKRRYDLQRQLIENAGAVTWAAREGDAVAEIEGWDLTNPAAVYVPQFAAPVQEDATVSVKTFGWILVAILALWALAVVGISVGLYYLLGHNWGLVVVTWIVFLGLIGIRFAIGSVRMGGR